MARRGKFSRVDDLADAARIGRTTMVAIETGRKTATETMYTQLEIALEIPLGTMQRVLDGEIKVFPGMTKATEESGVGENDSGSTVAYEVAGEVYTRDELRAIARALGKDEFMAWALRPTPDEGGSSASG